MNKLILMLYLLPTLALAETIYRSVDEEGNVIFSDQPTAGSEKIELKKAPAVDFEAPSPLPPLNRDSEADQQGYYSNIAIQKPTNEQTVRDNQGNVPVSIALSPGLKEGHQLAIELDGKRVLQDKESKVTLQNVDRGAHQLVVRVIDEKGKAQLSSSPVTFYLHRISKLTTPQKQKNDGQVTPLNPPTATPEGVTPTNPPKPRS